MVTLTELIKKEVGVEKIKISEEEKAKGAVAVGNLTMEQVVKIAKMKREELFGKDFKAVVKMVVGTICSMPITIENKKPKEILKEIEIGKWDELIQS